MAEETEKSLKITLASKIVSAYVSNNPVSYEQLHDLINSVYACVQSLSTESANLPSQNKPAVPISRSVHEDYIICLEDGKRFKSLKRHLRTYYNMTPEEYRAKWHLPNHYPIVAPNYAKKRSQLAREFGLGKKSATKAN